MGTNYYHRTNICECCGRYDEKHIGKSSAGWVFEFRGYRKQDPCDDSPVIESYADWLKTLEVGGEIHDEYGTLVSLKDFKRLVAMKQSYGTTHSDNTDNDWILRGYAWLDSDGYSFTGREFS